MEAKRYHRATMRRWLLRKAGVERVEVVRAVDVGDVGMA